MNKSALDITTGTITLDSMSVGPGLSRAEFLESPLGAKRQESVTNEPHHSWKVAVDVGGRSCWAVLYFTGESLSMLHLVLREGRTATSWADWSEDEEMAIKDAHEDWLREEWAVTPPQEFAWGRIVSVYDAIGGFSFIGLDYRLGQT